MDPWDETREKDKRQVREPEKSGLGFLMSDLERQLRDIKRERGSESVSPTSPQPGQIRPSSKWGVKVRRRKK